MDDRYLEPFYVHPELWALYPDFEPAVSRNEFYCAFLFLVVAGMALYGLIGLIYWISLKLGDRKQKEAP